MNPEIGQKVQIAGPASKGFKAKVGFVNNNSETGSKKGSECRFTSTRAG